MSQMIRMLNDTIRRTFYHKFIELEFHLDFQILIDTGIHPIEFGYIGDTNTTLMHIHPGRVILTHRYTHTHLHIQ